LTAAALAIFAMSLVFQNLTMLFVRAYYAAGKTKKPFIAKFINAATTILFGYLFMLAFMKYPTFQYFLESLFKVQGIPGSILLTLPLGWTVGGIVNSLALWLFFEKDFRGFTEDGITILEWLKKKRSEYFNLRSTKLVGIEIPIEQYIIQEIPNVIMTGSIDLIFYNKNTETYEIWDIKTYTKGWNDNDKKDKNKISQLLLYKHFYSRALNVPIDKIEVRFFIVKRRPYVSPDFPTKYVQEFIPAQGTKKVKDAVAEFESFVRETFTTDAKYITEREYTKNLDGCKWCPFKDKPEHCDRTNKKVLL
jgi:hypothetical protein